MDDDSSDGSIGSPTSPPQPVYGDEIVGRLRSSPSFSSFEDLESKKKKTNFSVFGQKLSHNSGNKAKKKEQPPSSLNIFRNSKTDIKSLRMKTDLGLHNSINAARSSINDRSPMARTSKEIDRIASLGPPTIMVGSPLLDPPPQHKRHHMFSKKNSPQTVLSSSASNSRLGSEGSVYSFQIAPKLNLEKSLFKSIEDCQQTMGYTWALISSRIQPIFTECSLRIPVEDVNTLVSVHFQAHVASGGTPLDLLERMTELLCTGLRDIRPRSHHSLRVIDRCAEVWRVFSTKTLLMLEAVFLPLQLEMDGAGSVLTDQFYEYWLPARKLAPISVKRCILLAFRDTIFLPEVESLKTAMNLIAINESSAENAASVNQCVNVLTLIKSGDAAQDNMNTLSACLRESWMARPRVAKDRRGLVLKRSSSIAS